MIAPAQKKILIVDDEVNIRDIIRFRLQVEGYCTVEAKNGREAMQLFVSENPDIVILDIMMPEIDGWEVCKFIRESNHSDVPILMLTAKTEIKDKIQGIRVGANDYLTKPFSPNELVERIRKIVG